MTKSARRKPAYRLWWFWLLVLALVYLVAGFGLVPLYLSSAIPDRLQQHLGWSSEMGDVDFNPFTFTLSVDQLTASDDSGDRVFAVDGLTLNLGAAQLVRGTLHVEHLLLDNPFLRLDVMPDQAINLVEDWRRHNDDRSANDTMPLHILLDEGVVNGGHLQVRRMAPEVAGEPQVLDLEALGLTVTDVASRELDEPGAYNLQAVMGEQVLESSGSLNLVPLWSNGQLSLNDIAADTLRPWLGNHLPWIVQGGRLTLDTAFQFAHDDQGVALATREGRLRARDLELADPEQVDRILASAVTLDLEGVAFNLDGPELIVSRVTGDELHLDAELDGDGRLNLTRPLAGRGDGDAAAQVGTGLRWSVGNVTVKQSAIDWRDNRPADPVELTLQDVELDLGAMTEQLEEAISYQARASLAGGGSATANGQFTLQPLTFEGGVNLDQLALAPFSGYLRQVSELQVADGTINLSGNIDIDVQDDPLTGTFSGRGSISHFSGRLPDSEEPVMAWRELRLDPVEYNFAPARLELGTVTVSEPELDVIQYPDRPLNLSRVLAPANGSDDEGSREDDAGDESDTTGPGLIFRLRQMELADGEIRYTDRNPLPPFRSRLHDLQATVSGLSNITPQQGRFSLTGVVDDSGDFRADGTIATLGTEGDSELEARLDGLSLPVLNPYFGFYLGYRVDSGKLSATGNYQFKGTRIEATNELVLDRLELGEEVQSDSEITGPVRLGLALLQDSDNRLTLGVPVSGDLANPQFSLGPVMMRTFRSALVKAATSPFNLLGAIVDLGDYDPEQLSEVAFTPGETTLAIGEYTKMETVARALEAREEVVLTIRGLALESVDRPALEEELGEDESLPEDALADLASQRGTTLKRLLEEEYGVSGEQIFLQEPRVDTGEDEDDRVAIEFELEAR